MHSVGLSDYVKTWPTPTAMEYVDGGTNFKSLAKVDKGGRILRRIATLTLAGKMVAKEHKSGGSLNPMWVSWLMGFPLDWLEEDGGTLNPTSQESPQELRTGSKS